eukprot:CAMPEP_0176498916 /NCGR_PEP_ID=MMETSP0200_2-20121128/12616_1 /TAXON_ID=947934 /ORGANISM="Chaetoceros sp., Strain GSL56" /LENGTH=445 /DNA_ID=CAMNT_0017897235 /DNA_START=263 /DNA_END=1597 /DNA_ORIENTATION=-
MNIIKDIKEIIAGHAVSELDIKAIDRDLNHPKKKEMTQIFCDVIPEGIGTDVNVLMKNMTLRELKKAYFLKNVICDAVLLKQRLGSCEDKVVQNEWKEKGRNTRDEEGSDEDKAVTNEEKVENRTAEAELQINCPVILQADAQLTENLLLTDSTKNILDLVALEQKKSHRPKRKRDKSCSSSGSSSSTSSSSSSSSSSSTSSSMSISSSMTVKKKVEKYKSVVAHIRKKLHIQKIPYDVLKIVRATIALPEDSIVMVDETVKFLYADKGVGILDPCHGTCPDDSHGDIVDPSHGDSANPSHGESGVSLPFNVIDINVAPKKDILQNMQILLNCVMPSLEHNIVNTHVEFCKVAIVFLSFVHWYRMTFDTSVKLGADEFRKRMQSMTKVHGEQVGWKETINEFVKHLSFDKFANNNPNDINKLLKITKSYTKWTSIVTEKSKLPTW